MLPSEWLGPDGYYDVRIRGKKVSVYCKTSAHPAQTFFDVEASATQGANNVVTGEQPTTIAIHRALVEYNQCLIRVNRVDASFYTVTLSGTHSGSPPGASLRKHNPPLNCLLIFQKPW